MTTLPVFDIVGIIACLGISAIFSGSETALTSLDPVRVRRMLDEGGREADAIRLWQRKPDEVLTTILIFNNAANITASALATELAHKLLDPYAASAFVSPVAIAIGVTTLLLLTFGEIIPKTYARVHAARLAAPAMRILRPAHKLVRIPTLGFVALARSLGASPREVPIVEEADLEYLVGLGEAEGAISGNQARMVQGVFELDDQTAADVMVPLHSVVCVPETITLDELQETLVSAGHSRVPVYAGDRRNVVGLCYAKDVLAWVTAASVEPPDEPFRVADIMRPPWFVPGRRTIDVVLRQMQDQRVHLGVVVLDGVVAGLVTFEDVIEELIGDVFDEHDRVNSGVFVPALGRRVRRRAATPQAPIVRVDEGADTTVVDRDAG